MPFFLFFSNQFLVAFCQCVCATMCHCVQCNYQHAAENNRNGTIYKLTDPHRGSLSFCHYIPSTTREDVFFCLQPAEISLHYKPNFPKTTNCAHAHAHTKKYDQQSGPHRQKQYFRHISDPSSSLEVKMSLHFSTGYIKSLAVSL